MKVKIIANMSGDKEVPLIMDVAELEDACAFVDISLCTAMISTFKLLFPFRRRWNEVHNYGILSTRYC